MQPKRTAATEADYARRASQLIARIGRQPGMAGAFEVGPTDVVRYLDHRRADLAPASWRQYKASLLVFARARAEAEEAWGAAAAAMEAMRWSSDATAPKTRRPKRTSVRKDKSPSDEELDQLQDWLALHNAPAAAFFNAARLTGLRPKEWCKVKLVRIGERLVLVVKNAKSTNGRSHGKYRRLWFDELNFQQLHAIRTTGAMFKDAAKANGYDALLERLQRAFSDGAASLWPRRRRKITPYSLRHVFAGRIKKTYTPAEVGALMGHGVDNTAFSHYGRRTKRAQRGQSPTLPKADPKNVSRVKARYAGGLAAFAEAKAKAGAVVDQAMEPTPADEADVDSTPRPEPEDSKRPRYSA